MLPAKIVFSAGGVEGRYLILEVWSSTEDYPINTILKHNGNVWVAPSDPAVGAEPGVDAVWNEVTGSGGGGSGGGTIPHVGRIPTVTPDSPDLIFLTHDEYEGNREDATLTIAQSGSFCGYSDGSIYPAHGSISEPSPISTILGVWDATNSQCDLSEVITGNEGWLDDQVQIVGDVGGTAFTCDLGTRFATRTQYAKRVLSCTALEDLALGDIDINFFNADTPPDPYWRDGDITHPAGLYEKVGTPLQYHDIRPIEESHREGQGSFACGSGEPPDDGGQVCIDSDGRASFSSDRTVITTTPAEITSISPLVSDYWQGASSDVIGFNNTGENGEFKWYLVGDTFFQIQGTRATATIIVEGTATTEIPSGSVFDRDGVGTTRIRTTADATIEADGDVEVAVEAVSAGQTGNNIPADATFTLEDPIAGVNDSARIQTGFSGGSGNGLITITEWPDIWDWISGIDDSDTAQEQTLHETLRDSSVFLGEFSQQSDAAEDRDGFASATDRYFYILHDEEDTIQEITGFTESVSTETDQHEWRGPVVTIEDVHDTFEANSGDEVTHALDEFRIGDRIYSVIVRPDPATGLLRDPIASDYESNDAESRVVAVVDGVPFKVKRTLTLGHSAAGTFTALPEFTEFTVGGDTYRYRIPHHGDRNVPNPLRLDFYYDLSGHKWRVRMHPTFGHGYWADLHEGSDLLSVFDWVEYENSELEALATATDNGQRFVFRDSNGVHQTFTLSDFTAGAPEHYTYSWVHAIKTPVPLPAIAESFPSDADDASNEHFYAVRDDDYNTQVGYTARSTGDVWIMESGVFDPATPGLPDLHGYYRSGTDEAGELTPSTQFQEIVWRDVQGNPNEVRVRVQFASASDLYNLSSVSDGDLRIRYQRRGEDYNLPNETGWFNHTMDRFGTNLHTIWQTEAISTNPFREGQESWIAFEVNVSGEWLRLNHDSLSQYLALIDHRDLSHETPTSTNTGIADFGLSGNVAREDHQHGGPAISQVTVSATAQKPLLRHWNPLRREHEVPCQRQ